MENTQSDANRTRNLSLVSNVQIDDDNEISFEEKESGKSPPERIPSLEEVIEEEKKEENEKFENFFHNISYDGLAEIYDASTRAQKMVWISIVVICTVGLFYELGHTIADFYNNPILTTYTLVNDPTELKFPEVYICPGNPIHRKTREKVQPNTTWEELYTHGLSKAHITNSTSTKRFGPILSQKMTASQYQTGLLSAGGKWEGWIPKDISEYFKRVGYPKNVFIKECAFNGHPIDCDEITTEIYDGDYGKCFKLSISETQRRVGLGLTLVLDLDIDNAYPRVSTTDKNLPKPFEDVVLIKVDEMLDIGSQLFTSLSPGTSARILMETKKFTLIERNRENGGKTCAKMSKHKQFKELSANYSSGVCEMDCFFHLGKSKCGCLMPIDKSFLRDKNPVFCTPAQLRECVYPAIEKHSEKIKECAMDCALSCEFWQYTMFTSSGRFPASDGKTISTSSEYGTTKEYKADLTEKHTTITLLAYKPPTLFLRPRTSSPSTINEVIRDGEPSVDQLTTTSTVDEERKKRQIATDKNKTKSDSVPSVASEQPTINPTYPPLTEEQKRLKEQARKQKMKKSNVEQSSKIVVDISFASLQYIEITQEDSMTFTTFVGNVGGQVGLWAGASMVTMVKFFMVLSPFCCYLAKKKALRRNKRRLAKQVWKKASIIRMATNAIEAKSRSKSVT